MRGNPLPGTWELVTTRSIPACAGEPASSRTWATILSVYPRVCGGTRAWQRIDTSDRGLSPRVRGNRDMGLVDVHPLRSIPACAGEPGLASTSTLMTGVYPRVCGGTRLIRIPDLHRGGLSPRVRGNHRRPILKLTRQRSIPACAGEPPPVPPRSPS